MGLFGRKDKRIDLSKLDSGDSGVRGSLRRKISSYREERKEQKQAYKEAKRSAKFVAIHEKARKDARKEVFEGGLATRIGKNLIGGSPKARPRVVYRKRSRKRAKRRARAAKSRGWDIPWAI